MALTQTSEYDCEIRGPYKSVQVRQSKIILEDGVEISRNYHRHVLHPQTKTDGAWGDTDLSGQDASIAAIAAAAWTDDIKAAYRTFTDAQEAAGPAAGE